MSENQGEDRNEVKIKFALPCIGMIRCRHGGCIENDRLTPPPGRKIVVMRPTGVVVVGGEI